MNDSQLIDALGGTAKVAALCKVSMAAVSQWRDDGIPSARRMFLELARPDIFPAVGKAKRRKSEKAVQ